MATAESVKVLLLGAGHAHLHVAKHAERLAGSGAAVVLIDPGRFWYSGLATGVLAGMVEAGRGQVDAAGLIERAGGRFVAGRAVGVDLQARQVRLADGREMDYDFLSVNVGSEVAAEALAGRERAWAVKPIENLARLREVLVERLETSDGQVTAAVVGGGATGCEVAASLDGLARRHGGKLGLTLISRSQRLLEGYPQGAGARMEALLRERGVRVLLECEAQAIEPGRVVCRGGQVVEAETVVLAMGLGPARFVREQQWDKDAAGLRVRATLQTISSERVFAAGDCMSFSGRRLPKLGVFGVRQGPVLLENLVAAIEGKAMRVYRPQRRWVSILNLGDGTALASWGPWYWRGRSMLRLKNRLDFGFLRRYEGR